MPEIAQSTSKSDGLIVSRRAIATARSRDAQASDGGSTGKTDSND